MGNFSFGDLFQFERMVAPTVLKIVYWLGLAGVVIWFLIALLAGVRMLEYNAAAGLGSVLIAFLGLLFGTLIWRIVIEIYMVIFSINDRLGEIRDSLKKD
ncbi:MAG: DUF4282 domain-containing protein [Sphingomonas sp.]